MRSSRSTEGCEALTGENLDWTVEAEGGAGRACSSPVTGAPASWWTPSDCTDFADRVLVGPRGRQPRRGLRVAARRCEPLKTPRPPPRSSRRAYKLLDFAAADLIRQSVVERLGSG